MGLACTLLRHAPQDERWNAGWAFVRYRRCGCDLLRGAGDWAPVPAGHRVVWKAGWHRHSLANPLSRAVVAPPEPRRDELRRSCDLRRRWRAWP